MATILKIWMHIKTALKINARYSDRNSYNIYYKTKLLKINLVNISSKYEFIRKSHRRSFLGVETNFYWFLSKV